MQCVDAVRASAKLELLGETGGILTSSGELVLDLGRALYKLHFQLVMVLEAANRMVGALTIAAESNQVLQCLPNFFLTSLGPFHV